MTMGKRIHPVRSNILYINMISVEHHHHTTMYKIEDKSGKWTKL